MIFRVCLLSLVIGGSALATPSPQSAGSDMLKSLREAMHLPPDTVIEFAAEDGTPLTMEEFMEAVRKPGMALTPQKDPPPGKAIFRLYKKPDAGPVPAKLPALDMKDLSGKRFRNADLASKPTLLSFYFSTCVPCIQEVPALNEFRRKHPELNFLAITFDSAEEAREFVAQHKLEWPVIPGARQFIDQAAVSGFPAYLLVAQDGRIVGRDSGLQMDTADPVPGLKALESWVSEHLKLL